MKTFPFTFLLPLLFWIPSLNAAKSDNPKVEFFITVEKGENGVYKARCDYRVDGKSRYSPDVDVGLFKTVTKVKGDTSQLSGNQAAGTPTPGSAEAAPPPPGNTPPPPPPPPAPPGMAPGPGDDNGGSVDLESVAFSELVEKCKSSLILRLRVENADKPTMVKLTINFADTNEETDHKIQDFKKTVALGRQTKCWSGKLRKKPKKE